MLDDKSILFISHLIPRECYDEVISNSKNNMQDAANALQWHLVEGFSHNLRGNLDIINFMPIASYPQYYKKAWIKSNSFNADINTPAFNIGFCNVKYIRRQSIAKGLFKSVDKWCKKNANTEKIIIIYTLNSIVLKTLSKIKSCFSNITICAIVADLPNMTNLSSSKNLIKKAADKNVAAASYAYIDIVDKFVFLTKYMSDYLNNKKPYCVMEGIATDHSKEIADGEEWEYSDYKTVLYTGTLHKRFGVMHLVDAFSMIKDPDYRLVICGVGDSEREIRDAAKKDSRIVCLGQCSRNEVLRFQRLATVLVNPRMNNEEFTKYSFPSKNLEYLSSGTPLIAYKLDGISDEYDDYISYVSENTEKALAGTIMSICEMSLDRRKALGEKARSFVVDYKDCLSQTQKIINLIHI